MDDKELEQTKEINTLKDLSLEALNNLEDSTYEEEISLVEQLSEFDENLEQSDIVFQTEVETKEEMKEELKKENIFKKIGKNWNTLSKKNKIMIISGGVILLILIAVGLFFLLKKEDSSILPPDPDVILERDNYRYENGKLIFLDGDKELGKYECENKNETLCELAYLENNGEFDEVKKVDEDGNPLKLHSSIYYDRFVFVVDKKNEADKAIRLYDMKEEKVLKTVFQVKAYDDDYVALKNEESQYGLEKMGENEVSLVIPYEYDALGILPGDKKYVSVRKDNNYYLADFENKILTKALPSSIVGATDKYLKTKDNTGKYHVYDYNGKQVNEATSEYVLLLDELMISVQNNQLYVIDYNGNPMSREGIALNNDKYNGVETYKDLKLIKKIKAFDVELSESVLNINIYNADGTDKENVSLNLAEGELSSKLAYMDYYQGTIGFYKDLAKKELIGTYKCNNRNTVEKGTNELNNCRIATESYFRETTGNTKEVDESSKLAWIPIFGRRYAFIKDGDTIVLYSITDGRELAKYEAVDTSSYTGVNEITLSEAGTIPFIAKSKSSSMFGVAKITAEGVMPVIPFEYQSIKRLGDYYVVESKDGYSLYDLNGNQKTATVVSSIVDYHGTYLKTFKDNSYYVYDFEGKGTGNGYTYLELYDSYYAAVLKNKVRLYDYAGKDLFENIPEKINDKLELKLNNYYGNGTKAFRVGSKPISIDGEKYYVVEIGTVSGEYITVNVPVDNQEVPTGDEDES